MFRSLQEYIRAFARPFTEIPVVGFDISDRSIKYIRLRRATRSHWASRGMTGQKEIRAERKNEVLLAVDFFGEIEMPEGIIVNGEIVQEDSLIAIIRAHLKKENVFRRSPFVAVSLPEEKSFVRAIPLSGVKKEDVANAIRWEIESHIPLPLEDLAYDHATLAISGDHIDAVVVAFPKTIISSYVKTLTRAGLQLVAFEPESHAIARTMPDHAQAVRVLVDMGRLRTGIAVLAGDMIIYTTTVEVGGKLFEENIARSLGVSAEQAVAIKKEVGLRRDLYEGKVFSALIPAITALLDGLKRAMDYYVHEAVHSHGMSAAVTEIYMTGGDANLFGLDAHMAAALRIPVGRHDPFLSLSHRWAHQIPLMQNQSMQFAAALGLALRPFG